MNVPAHTPIDNKWFYYQLTNYFLDIFLVSCKSDLSLLILLRVSLKLNLLLIAIIFPATRNARKNEEVG